MKRLLFIFLSFFIVTSCSSDSAANATNTLSSVNLTDAITDHGLFRIATFIEEGNNKTTLVSQHTFSFEANNLVTVQINSETTIGYYNIFVDDGKIELMLNFPNNPELIELNDDWYFISQTDNSFRFEDSGDIIEFSKL